MISGFLIIIQMSKIFPLCIKCFGNSTEESPCHGTFIMHCWPQVWAHTRRLFLIHIKDLQTVFIEIAFVLAYCLLLGVARIQDGKDQQHPNFLSVSSQKHSHPEKLTFWYFPDDVWRHEEVTKILNVMDTSYLRLASFKGFQSKDAISNALRRLCAKRCPYNPFIFELKYVSTQLKFESISLTLFKTKDGEEYNNKWYETSYLFLSSILKVILGKNITLSAVPMAYTPMSWREQACVYLTFFSAWFNSMILLRLLGREIKRKFNKAIVLLGGSKFAYTLSWYLQSLLQCLAHSIIIIVCSELVLMATIHSYGMYRYFALLSFSTFLASSFVTALLLIQKASIAVGVCIAGHIFMIIFVTSYLSFPCDSQGPFHQGHFHNDGMKECFAYQLISSTGLVLIGLLGSFDVIYPYSLAEIVGIRLNSGKSVCSCLYDMSISCQPGIHKQTTKTQSEEFEVIMEPNLSENVLLSMVPVVKAFPRKSILPPNFEFFIPSKKTTVLLGISGCSESYILNTMIGKEHFSSEKIVDRNGVLPKIRVCPSYNFLSDYLTVEQTFSIFQKIMASSSINLDWRDVAHDFNLTHRLKTNILKLSENEKQLVVLAIAFLCNDRVLLLDEPINRLKGTSLKLAIKYLQKQRGSLTILMTCSNVEESLEIADNIAVVVNGQIRIHGSVSFVRRCLGVGTHLKVLVMRRYSKLLISYLWLLEPRLFSLQKLNSDKKDLSYLNFFLAIEDKSIFEYITANMDFKINSLGIISLLTVNTTLETVLERCKDPLLLESVFFIHQSAMPIGKILDRNVVQQLQKWFESYNAEVVMYSSISERHSNTSVRKIRLEKTRQSLKQFLISAKETKEVSLLKKKVQSKTDCSSKGLNSNNSSCEINFENKKDFVRLRSRIQGIYSDGKNIPDFLSLENSKAKMIFGCMKQHDVFLKTILNKTYFSLNSFHIKDRHFLEGNSNNNANDSQPDDDVLRSYYRVVMRDVFQIDFDIDNFDTISSAQQKILDFPGMQGLDLDTTDSSFTTETTMQNTNTTKTGPTFDESAETDATTYRSSYSKSEMHSVTQTPVHTKEISCDGPFFCNHVKALIVFMLLQHKMFLTCLIMQLLITLVIVDVIFHRLSIELDNLKLTEDVRKFILRDNDMCYLFHKKSEAPDLDKVYKHWFMEYNDDYTISKCDSCGPLCYPEEVATGAAFPHTKPQDFVGKTMQIYYRKGRPMDKLLSIAGALETVQFHKRAEQDRVDTHNKFSTRIFITRSPMLEKSQAKFTIDLISQRAKKGAISMALASSSIILSFMIVSMNKKVHIFHRFVILNGMSDFLMCTIESAITVILYCFFMSLIWLSICISWYNKHPFCSQYYVPFKIISMLSYAVAMSSLKHVIRRTCARKVVLLTWISLEIGMLTVFLFFIPTKWTYTRLWMSLFLVVVSPLRGQTLCWMCCIQLSSAVFLKDKMPELGFNSADLDSVCLMDVSFTFVDSIWKVVLLTSIIHVAQWGLLTLIYLNYHKIKQKSQPGNELKDQGHYIQISNLPTNYNVDNKPQGDSSITLLAADLPEQPGFRNNMVNENVDDKDCLVIFGDGATSGNSNIIKQIIMQQSEGSIRINGKCLPTLSPFHCSKDRLNIGYCPHDNELHPGLSARNTLSFFAQIRSRTADYKATIAIDKLLKDVDLSLVADKVIGTYSAEEERKLHVAIAFIGEPHLILLDHPTLGLGLISKHKIWKMIHSYRVKGKVIIIASSCAEESYLLGTRFVILEEGFIKAKGSFDDIDNSSEGYFAYVWLTRNDDGTSTENKIIHILREMQTHFRSGMFTIVSKVQNPYLIFPLIKIIPDYDLSKIYGAMEMLKELHLIRSYMLQTVTKIKVLDSYKYDWQVY